MMQPLTLLQPRPGRGGRRKAAALLALVAVLALPLPLTAQIPGMPPPAGQAAEEPADPLSRDAILARRAAVQKTIEDLRRRPPAGAEAELAAEELAELERAERLLGLQLGELRRAEELAGKAAASRLEERLGHPPPYSVADLDTVLDDREAAAAARTVVEEQVEVSRRAADSARGQLNDAEKRLRLARDQSPATSDTQRRRLRGLEGQVRSAEERLRLRRLQLDNTRRELERETAREAEIGRQAQLVRREVRPAEAELASILEALAEEDRELGERLAAAREQASAIEPQLAAAEEQLELAAVQDPALVALVDARRLELDAARTEEDVVTGRRDRLQQLSLLWRLRFRLLGDGIPADGLAQDQKRLGDELDELERERRLTEARLGERRLALRLANERRPAEGEGAAVRRRLQEQRQALEPMIALYEEELADLEATARLARRLRGEAGTLSGHLSLGERARLVGDKVAAAWSYEITAADGRPITVGKVVQALLLILLGLWLSKAVSRWLGRTVFPRLGLVPGAAVAFQTLVFYLLVVVFVLWALQTVGIPLTVFTVLGGVLAIGLGFGSQNIVNNFISGLIILAEHPIKVGDLIEVDGIFGKVERIGPRSSQVRSGDNTHVIVPNSAFLEKNVLNWTVSDDVLRTSVDVGVAYGSPVETVAELLRQAVAEDPTILGDPAPEVLFMDFGDNALAFRAYFWVRVTRPLDLHRAQSRLRFRIDALFHQAGIVIAFPQRDVHLDSLKPVEVRLVGDGGGVSGSGVGATPASPGVRHDREGEAGLAPTP